MANVTIDKKQLPQVAALGTLSACVFGYFGFKMIAPPPTQAAPPATTGTSATGASGTSGATAGTAGSANSGGDAGTVDPSALIGAAAPSPVMRDPFAATSVPAASGPKASAGVTSSSAPSALPALASLNGTYAKPQRAPALPATDEVAPLPGSGAPAPVAPQVVSPGSQWSVSGVICSDADPSLSLAIFRSGNVRRYVRVGEWLDSATRLISLDRAGVVVSRSGMHFRLTLGAATEAPGAQQQQPSSQQLPTAAAAPASSGTMPPLQIKGELPTPAPDSLSVPAQPASEIAAATPPVSGATSAPAQVASLNAPLPSAIPPQASDVSDASLDGAADIPTFNAALPATSAVAVGQLTPASWTPQGSMPFALDSGVGVATLATYQPSGGSGMALVSTPSSVLQALGLDSALFGSQPGGAGTASAEDAIGGGGTDALASLDSSDLLPTLGDGSATADAGYASAFQQYDALATADMAQIDALASPDQAVLQTALLPGAQTAPAPTDDDLSTVVNPSFQPLYNEFTS